MTKFTDITYNLLVALSFTAIVVLLFTDLAIAQESPFAAVDDKGGELTSWLTDGFIKIIGTVAIVGLSVAMAMGKVHWGIALTVILAIIIGFNAISIVEALK